MQTGRDQGKAASLVIHFLQPDLTFHSSTTSRWSIQTLNTSVFEFIDKGRSPHNPITSPVLHP
jgi:hypothetical protein